MLKAQLKFISQTIRNFHSTGAIAPSSSFLAKAMTRALDARPKTPWKILEVGPGTGPMTEMLVKKMHAQDELECYELNTLFCNHLRERFQRELHFQRRAQQVVIHEKDICGLPAGQRYDMIICGLPFNNFQPELAQKIMALMYNALKPGASLTFFEYLFLRQAKCLVTPNRAERERLTRIEQIMHTFSKKGEYRDEAVWMNLPPALVRTMIKPK